MIVKGLQELVVAAAASSTSPWIPRACCSALRSEARQAPGLLQDLSADNLMENCELQSATGAVAPIFLASPCGQHFIQGGTLHLRETLAFVHLLSAVQPAASQRGPLRSSSLILASRKETETAQLRDSLINPLSGKTSRFFYCLFITGFPQRWVKLKFSDFSRSIVLLCFWTNFVTFQIFHTRINFNNLFR